MKKTLIALTMIASTSAFASYGQICKDVEGALTVVTNEAAMTGDNVMSIQAKVYGKLIRFNKVAASTEYSNKIYMGSNRSGDSVTLELNTAKREGLQVSTVILKLSNRQIIKETSLLCKGSEQ